MGTAGPVGRRPVRDAVMIALRLRGLLAVLFIGPLI
jgi:hypothetical protein